MFEDGLVCCSLVWQPLASAASPQTLNRFSYNSRFVECRSLLAALQGPSVSKRSNKLENLKFFRLQHVMDQNSDPRPSFQVRDDR
jgi:hypothetical protein